jgi:hypothetical protein
MSGVRLAWNRHVGLHPGLPDDQSAPYDDYRESKHPTAPGLAPSRMHRTEASGSKASARERGGEPDRFFQYTTVDLCACEGPESATRRHPPTTRDHTLG